MNVSLYFLQRASALLLAPLVLAHLGLIIYAVRGGLTAAEILSRTQGSIAWGLFYSLFVLAAAIHAGIGLRVIIQEWTPLTGRSPNAVGAMFGAFLLVLGLRAVYAVVAG